MVPLQIDGLLAAPEDGVVLRLALAAALGMFLGLEREWSEKSAGVRTFSLISLAGAVFAVLAREPGLGEGLLVVGGLLVIVQGVLLAVQGLRAADTDALSLTTSVSMLVAYGVGALVATGHVVPGVAVAVVSSLLLVLKRELHGLAGELSRAELRASAEFAILAFVVYPLLPADPIPVLGVPVEPRVAWAMVVTVAAIGIVNYVVVAKYGSRGVVVTGFFGGLASSTAVVGTMLDHVRQRPEAAAYGVAAVLLADGAMALRNLVIALAFTLSPAAAGPLVGVVVPLGTLVAGSLLIAWVTADWDEPFEIDLDSPFSLRNALGFGLVFLFVLVAGAAAETRLGTVGLYASALLSGLVSSAGATTTAVLLYRGGTIDAEAAGVAVLLATAASVAVKAGLVLAGPRALSRRVVGWSGALLAAAGVATLAFGAAGVGW